MSLPYPLASIVMIPNVPDRKYLIESISPGPLYAISGHSILNSRGFGSAWHEQDALELVSQPTEDSWKMWEDIQDDSSPEFKYGDPDWNDDND